MLYSEGTEKNKRVAWGRGDDVPLVHLAHTVSELLLHAGPAGAYCFQFLDIDGTPGDRLKLRKELAAAVTRLELD